MFHLISVRTELRLPQASRPDTAAIANWFERALAVEQTEVRRLGPSVLEFKTDALRQPFRGNQGAIQGVRRGVIEIEERAYGFDVTVVARPHGIALGAIVVASGVASGLLVGPAVQVTVASFGLVFALMNWGVGWLQLRRAVQRIGADLEHSYTQTPVLPR